MVNNQDGSTEAASQSPEQLSQEEKAKKKKDKIRSAWISFVGRIIAQILGAVATITLGLALADRIRSDAARNAGAASPDRAQQMALLPHAPRDPRPSLAVLPLELFSPDAAQQYLADSLTEELVASLLDGSALRVVSRTSARQYGHEPRSIPEIAAALRVDVVVEGCVLHEGDRVRIRLRAMDGSRDAHLGTVVRESGIRDAAARRTEIAVSAARELTDIVLASFRP